MSTYHRTLGLAEGASLEEVSRAYRVLAKKLHPDMGGSSEEFRALHSAYTFLRQKLEQDIFVKHRSSNSEYRQPGFKNLGEFISATNIGYHEIDSIVKQCADMEIYNVLNIVRNLKRNGQIEDALRLVMLLVSWTEEEQFVFGGVAPAYYLEAAILLRKLGRSVDEIALLERFSTQQHAPGVTPKQLLERLQKLRSKHREYTSVV